MIAGLLKTRWIFAVLPVAIFLGFLWLHRAVAKADTEASKPVEVAQVSGPASATAGRLLEKAAAYAEDRGEAVRREPAREATRGEIFDEAGDVSRRRLTPEPLLSGTELNASNASEPPVQINGLLVPALRISGRSRSPKADSLIEHPKVTAPNLSEPAKAVKKLRRFVPFGRLIKAELVITLESTHEEMPLIGLITEPIYNNGHLVIPAGTEVHGVARPDRLRDRIIAENTWHLVFPREGNRPNGRELIFDGVALDREDRDGNGLTWGIADGSLGLSGRVIRSSQTIDEIMVFAAAALKVAGGAQMDRQTTLVGQSLNVSARNSALAGAQGVLDELARQISEELKRNGSYVQVPAGKTFYVYPRQVIDADRAEITEKLEPSQ